MDKMDKARRVLSGSATSALAALLMVGAIAFGSTVIRPMTINHEPEATTAQADDGAAGTDGGTTAQGGYAHGGDQADTDGKSDVEVDEDYPKWKPADQPADEPKDEPAEEPKDEPAAEPKDDPKDDPKDEPKPDPAPSGPMTLQANFNADKGKIVVKWTAFSGDFEKYKLVRSWDATVTWPEGEGDTLVGAFGPDGNYFIDTDAPCNDEVHYRVFAVRHGEEGYVVLGASNVDGALRACSNEPPAEPKAMGFDLMQVEGGVKLAWEQCSSEQFAVYKVVRSATNPNPLYPLNDGTELIAAIGDSGTTIFFDSNVEPGQTWTYRILSLGSNGDGWFVLGLTDAKTITVE